MKRARRVTQKPVAAMLINIRDFENLLAALPAGATFGPVTIQYDCGCLTVKRVAADRDPT